MITDDLPLKAVARFVDFDLENDRELLEIIELASAVTNCPYAIISFLDNGTHYLKVRKGIRKETFPNDFSFSPYFSYDNELMMIPDALSDERLTDHPLVSGNAAIRFLPACLYCRQKEKNWERSA